MIRTFALIVAMICIPIAQAEEMKPGLWEITSQMRAQGMQMPAMKFTHCYSSKDISEGRHYRPDPQNECKMSNLKQSGNDVSFDMKCQDGGQAMTMSVKGTVTATTFRFEQKMRTAEMGEMLSTTQGKRIGDCK